MMDELRAAYDAGYAAAFNETESNPYNDGPYTDVAQAWDDGFLDGRRRYPHFHNLSDLFYRAFGEDMNQSWYNQFVKLSPVERCDTVVQLLNYEKKRNA